MMKWKREKRVLGEEKSFRQKRGWGENMIFGENIYPCLSHLELFAAVLVVVVVQCLRHVVNVHELLHAVRLKVGLQQNTSRFKLF